MVKDAQPIFGKNGGMWIGYSLSEKGLKCGRDTNYFEQVISSLIEKPLNEVSKSVLDLIEVCKKANINTNIHIYASTRHSLRIQYNTI